MAEKLKLRIWSIHYLQEKTTDFLSIALLERDGHGFIKYAQNGNQKGLFEVCSGP